MRATLFALPAALALAACVEVDMTVEVLGEDEARVSEWLHANAAPDVRDVGQ